MLVINDIVEYFDGRSRGCVFLRQRINCIETCNVVQTRNYVNKKKDISEDQMYEDAILSAATLFPC